MTRGPAAWRVDCRNDSGLDLGRGKPSYLRRVISNGVVSTKFMRSSKCKGMFSCHQRQVMKENQDVLIPWGAGMQNADEIHCPNSTPHTLRPKGPHKEAAITGKSSLWAIIYSGCWAADHTPRNNSQSRIPPKPSEPAALVEAWKSEWGGQNLRPSHERKNSHNQDRSRPRSRLGSTFGV